MKSTARIFPQSKSAYGAIVLLVFGFNCYPQSSAYNSQNTDHVTIVRKRVVLVRKESPRFPDRSRALVIYPTITGLKDLEALHRVRSILQLKNIFGSSLDDYRKDYWLEEFTYQVNYNRKYLLDITFKQSGMGAYPETQSKHFIIELRNGSVLKASKAFLGDKLEVLAALVDRKLQYELKRIGKVHQQRSDVTPVQVNEMYGTLRFGTKSLDDFSVGNRGITFLYDAGFAHVIKALEPQGHYFFSYAELKPYINPDGLLGQFIN